MMNPEDSSSFPNQPERPEGETPEIPTLTGAIPGAVDPANPPPVVTVAAPPPRSPWDGVRQFLACNPFYLLSAALLLYSFYLVSGDRTFLPSEVAQLSFNLGSLQIYELLLVITAVWLARRAVWYDSTLLVGLENLFVLVPFMLISEAALIQKHVVWVLCFGAALLAGLRMHTLKRFVARLNFPGRLAWIGSVMFTVNAALPAIYRTLHQSKIGKEPDFGAAFQANQYAWWALLPLVCLLALAVPLARNGKPSVWPERKWIPLGTFSLWLIGTGVHLYSLGYIYDFSMRPDLLAPAVWVLAWVLWCRVAGYVPTLALGWRNALWLLPMLATPLATSQESKTLFLVLTAINAVFYALLFRAGRDRFALHLVLISFVALLAGLPEEWGRWFMVDFTREKFIAAAAAIYLLACIALTKKAAFGLLGSILLALLVATCGHRYPQSGHWATQLGLVFLLLHSLRWVDPAEQGAGLLRWIAAFIWMIHSWFWVHSFGGSWNPALLAALVLAALGAWRLWRHLWGPAAIWIPALAVLLVAPADWMAGALKSAPAGLLAVLASFLLFGLGTLGALTKHRWHRAEKPTS